jgi:biotin carboxyl carrier protein
MDLEFKLNNRNVVVKQLKNEGDIYTFSVDDVIYEVDLARINEHEYSILHNGKSFHFEIIENAESKHFKIVSSGGDTDVEIIDNESRYLKNRNNQVNSPEDLIIRSPMPGRVIRVPVNIGEKVEAGQTVVILSAMKMESEYKAGKTGIITEIAVKEGDTVENNQILVVIEEC